MATTIGDRAQPMVGDRWIFCGKYLGTLPAVIVKIRRITHNPDEVWTERARYWLPTFIENHRPFDPATDAPLDGAQPGEYQTGGGSA